jgi:hypothetical protein
MLVRNEDIILYTQELCMAGYELATVPAPKPVLFKNVSVRFYLARATYYAQCLETNGITLLYSLIYCEYMT